MQPYNKNNAKTGDFIGLKSVLNERVIEGLQHYNLTSDLQLTYQAPKNIILDTISAPATKVILPDATTLENGWTVFVINNDEISNINVCLFSDGGENPVFKEVETLTMAQCMLVDNSTVQGVWKLLSTGEMGSSELEQRYTTSVFDTVNISYRELGVGSEYSKTISTIPLDTPIKSIFIKPTEQFVGANIYMSVGTIQEPTKFYNNLDLTGEVTPSNYHKDLFEEILSTTSNKDLVAKFYTLHDSDNPWTLTTLGADDVEKAFYYNNMFVFVTSIGTVVTTTDFVTYHDYNLTNLFSFSPKSILLQDGYFYIACKKDGYFAIAKTDDFSSFTYYETSISITETPFGLAKVGTYYISTIDKHVIYGTNLENDTAWILGEEIDALTSINNVVSNGTICLINCLGFYFTTSNGSTVTQNGNAENFYHDYLDGKWIRYYKNSLSNYNLWYSNDLINWLEINTQTLNITNVEFANNTWFVFSSAGQYNTDVTISRNFFNTITRESIGFGTYAATCVAASSSVIAIGGEEGSLAYSTGDTFLTLSSGAVKIIIERVKDINPQTIKNPIINTQIPIGSIFNYPFADIPSGYFRLNGDIIENVHIVAENFLQKLIESANAGATNLFISNEQHLQKGGDTQEGWGYFSWVDDTSKDAIRLPKINSFVRGLASLNDLSLIATHIEAGIPNITGTFGRCVGTDPASGAFQRYGATTLNIGDSGSYNTWITFDASRSSEIYGKSNTVQPDCYVYPYIISVYNAVQETAEVNLISVSQLLERNNTILQEMYDLAMTFQSGKSVQNRQCVLTASTTNYVRQLSGLQIVCDANVVATNEQGYVGGLPNDIPIITTNSLTLELPSNSSGYVYLSKNGITNEVSLGYTTNWFEQSTQSSVANSGDIWNDIRQEKVYKYNGSTWETCYAVKIATFTTDTAMATLSVMPFRNKAFYDSFPYYAGAITRTWGTTYTADKNGYIIASITTLNSQAYITINGVQQAFGGYAPTTGGGDSIMIPISKGDTYLLSGNYSVLSRYQFVPCRGEVMI